jgi:DNA polymerase-3 subunit gamma/tau
MDKFIVSARKYRPQNFNTVVGQSHITTTLKNAIKNNQLAHAFLFCGPRGVGKTTCARILAKTVNCENRTSDGEACNICNSCVSFDQGTSFNIHELDAASNNSVDDIRVLTDQVRFAPQAGKYKVYIIDEVHMLSSQAFNAFLKTLEEPPPYAIFILATTEKHKIIPTILSRCQIFDFKRITNQDTVIHLQEISKKENIKADKAALHIIAQKSEGCLRDALSILDKIVSFTNGELNYTNTLEHLNILDEDYYFKLMRAMQEQNVSDAILMYDEINRKGFEGDLFLNGFAEFIRNILVSKDAKAIVLLEVADDFKPKYNETAKGVSFAYLISALNILNEAEINYKQARNKRLHVELTLIKLCYLLQAVELVNSDSDVQKKSKLEYAKPVAFKALSPIEIKKKNKDSSFNSSTEGKNAKLIIETAEFKQPKIITNNGEIAQPKIIAETNPGIPKLNTLDKIRQKAIEQNREVATAKNLDDEELYVAWGLYIEKLRQKNNNSGITNFKLAVLKIVDSNTIEIITQSTIQQKFIENERASLLEHLQSHFKNRFLTYKVVMAENENNNQLAEEHLNARQQYLRMIEEYPLVKELKDRLKLDLDY